jgi:hypothetical protein
MKLQNMPKYPVSPFGFEGIELDPFGKWKRKRFRKEGSDEVEEYSEEVRQPGEWTDTLQYVKLYLKNSKGGKWGLSHCGHNLFWYIITHIKPKQNFIHISEDEFLREFEYKKSSTKMYYIAVKELIERGIIAQMSGERRGFWVNHNIVFNGERLTLFHKMQKYHEKKEMDDISGG